MQHRIILRAPFARTPRGRGANAWKADDGPTSRDEPRRQLQPIRTTAPTRPPKNDGYRGLTFDYRVCVAPGGHVARAEPRFVHLAEIDPIIVEQLRSRLFAPTSAPACFLYDVTL